MTSCAGNVDDKLSSSTTTEGDKPCVSWSFGDGLAYFWDKDRFHIVKEVCLMDKTMTAEGKKLLITAERDFQLAVLHLRAGGGLQDDRKTSFHVIGAESIQDFLLFSVNVESAKLWSQGLFVAPTLFDLDGIDVRVKKKGTGACAFFGEEVLTTTAAVLPPCPKARVFEEVVAKIKDLGFITVDMPVISVTFGSKGVDRVNGNQSSGQFNDIHICGSFGMNKKVMLYAPTLFAEVCL
jgi:hypothetical protein